MKRTQPKLLPAVLSPVLSLTLALSLLFLLPGCGAGSSAGSPPSASSAPSPAETPVQGVPSTGALDFLRVGKDGNDNTYDKKNAEKVPNSPLEGKTIYWLGSSVTYGSGSSGQSIPHFLAETDGAVCVVDAMSGTTLAVHQTGEEDHSYLTRLQQGEKLDHQASIDLFVCQISTNDCKSEFIDALGELTPQDVTAPASFDTSTAAGALESVIRTVHDTWGCPIWFYSGAWFGDEGVRSSQDPTGSNYEKLVNLTLQAAEKWNQQEGYEVHVLDLYHDEEFNSLVSDEDYAFLMRDAIHPRKAGYSIWWLPAFREALSSSFPH